MRTIEWPKGSGRSADYSDEEYEVMRGFVRQCDAGLISKAVAISQINTLHDMKVEFFVNIAKDAR